jgi:HK97 family phage prohead protease
MDRLTVPIEWKASTEDAGTLEGYASTFGNVDLGYDVVEKGAFKATIADIKANGIPLLADHVASTASVLGTIFDAREDSKGLLIKARFSSAQSAQDVRTKLLEGHLNRMSIGYEPTKYAFEDRDGKTVRLLQEIKLWETSVVVFPMNPEAAVSRVKCLSADERKALAVALAEAEQDTTDSPNADGVGDAEARHAEAEETHEEAPAGDPEPTPWDHYASEALLAGEDPAAVADGATVAALRTRLELNETALGLDSDSTESE